MRVRLRGHHPLRPGIQPGSPHTRFSPLAAGASAPARPLPRHRCRNPRRVSHGTGLAIIRFRSPLLTEYPFLQVLRCFTSLRTPRKHSLRCRPTTTGGLPHSDTLGSKPCRRLPEAYRGPTRPSSVLPAKASTIRPWQQTHQPPHKRGPTGPCHLHWNTLRQLIRSSKHHPHQQCGRLTKTLANTIHAPTQQAGMERFDKINSTNTPDTPEGMPFMLASTLQFSNHHTTPPQPTPQGARPGQRERNTTPNKGGLAVREPNSMHHTTAHPHHQGAGALTFFQPARDTTRPGSQAAQHPHIGTRQRAHITP